MIFMRYIFGICKFTVKYIVAMLRYAKKLRLRHNLLCYCFHRSVSDCPVEARRSREKKGFFLAAISKFRSWQKLEFLEKILEFLEKSLEFFEILEFFWPWVFFKMSKKSLYIHSPQFCRVWQLKSTNAYWTLVNQQLSETLKNELKT